MIHEADIYVRKKLLPMFKDMDNTMVLSCLQGHMGTAWVDDLENPTTAQIMVGIFVYYAGNPYSKGAEELLHNLPEHIYVIVNSDEWKNAIETVHKEAFEKFQRYKFKKNPEDLKRSHIHAILSNLPEGYRLQKIDSTLAKESSLHEISPDLTSQFDSIDDFINRGIGYAILNEGQVVCGVSSYSIYNQGIEIEVATHPLHRRKGLASIASSALILECLDNGMYPSWDAANLESAKLAQKLGYTLEDSYDTYYIHYKNK
ncbi:GNAT family N-acetyltransferase [Bacillus spongiae]|uniref:GNAT family N-acetyltransferase n=1 Tax=Bacillus spongiae TaxID=2683610 RepID=A0ABU8HFX2_9BACI